MKKLLKSKLVMVLLLILVSAIGFSVAKELKERYTIEAEISDLQQQILSLQRRNTELSGLIGYFESPEYQEREARQKLSLQKPGEHVVVIPENAQPAPSPDLGDAEVKEANYKKWWDYFFGTR